MSVTADTFAQHSLLHVTARTAALSRARLTRFLNRWGMSESVWMALTGLEGCEGISVTALAEACGIQQPTMTKALDVLEKDHLVERRRSQRDRRVVGLHLTERGRVLARELTGEWTREQAEILAGLSPSQADAIRVAFAVLSAAAGRKEAPAQRADEREAA